MSQKCPWCKEGFINEYYDHWQCSRYNNGCNYHRAKTDWEKHQSNCRSQPATKGFISKSSTTVRYAPTEDNRCPLCGSYLHREGNTRVCTQYKDKYCSYKWYD